MKNPTDVSAQTCRALNRFRLLVLQHSIARLLGAIHMQNAVLTFLSVSRLASRLQNAPIYSPGDCTSTKRFSCSELCMVQHLIVESLLNIVFRHNNDSRFRSYLKSLVHANNPRSMSRNWSFYDPAVVELLPTWALYFSRRLSAPCVWRWFSAEVLTDTEFRTIVDESYKGALEAYTEIQREICCRHFVYQIAASITPYILMRTWRNNILRKGSLILGSPL